MFFVCFFYSFLTHKQTMPPSTLEAMFSMQARALSIPEPETEYKFHPTRKWRLDFAWPSLMLAIELNGGTWSNGRHSRGTGSTNDAQKGNTAQLMGWMVLTATSDMVRSGEAIGAVLEAIKRRT